MKFLQPQPFHQAHIARQNAKHQGGNRAVAPGQLTQAIDQKHKSKGQRNGVLQPAYAVKHTHPKHPGYHTQPHTNAAGLQG